MPTQEEEDRDAKRKAREERRKNNDTSSSTRRESSDRREKDRARRDLDSQASSTPGAYASTELSSPRSKKGSVKSSKSRSSGKSSDSIDKSDRSDRHSSRSSGKSRTSKPASVPGAVSSSTSSPHARRERRKAGADDSNRSNRSTPIDGPESPKSRSSGKSRTSKPAAVPGAVSSTSSPHSRKERRKTGQKNSPGTSRSNPARNTDARMQQKLQAAGLLDDEDGKEEELSKPTDDVDKNEEGEILLQATAVEENEEQRRPKERDVELEGGAPQAPPQNEEPRQEPPKRRYGVIVLVVLILGACAGAGAYFGTRGTSGEAAAPESTLSPTTDKITAAPTARTPTDPPTQGLKYPPPNDEDCQAIASGTPRQSENTTYTRNHLVIMDVVPVSGQENEPALEELQKAIQERLMPALAGCSDIAVDKAGIRYVILYGTISVQQVESSSSCLLDYSSPCYVVAGSLAIELQGQELPKDINAILSEVLDVVGAESLVSAWELESHFSNVVWTDVSWAGQTAAPSDSPSSVDSVPPTSVPTSAPVIGATNEPTGLVSPPPTPAVPPALAPTSAPVIGATNEPTGLASPPPTRAPSIDTIATKEPTSLPSPAPTTSAPTVTTSENPTLAPVIGPTTDEPTDLPSSMPSKTPSKSPTSLPSSSPTVAPTSEPSSVPTSPPTFGPMEGDELLSSHYVHFSSASYSSRADAQAGCEAKGLELCSQSAITNFELCAAGWLTDGAGWWMNSVQNVAICGGIGYNPASWVPEDQLVIGAYCCGRPLYLPDDLPPGCCTAYIYDTRDSARAACQSRGLGLCSKQQIEGFELCSYGWTTDWKGAWVAQPIEPQCPFTGFGAPPEDWSAGAYCCVEPDPTPAPTIAPSAAPTNKPSSNPSFELMEGDHLQNEHYIYYMPDDVPTGWPNYPYTSREEAQAVCETKGLTLCSSSAITNFELCAVGYLTDDVGFWMNQWSPGCGSAGFNGGFTAGIGGTSGIAGAYCCGRPLYVPEDRPSGCCASYIYGSRDTALAACRERGLGLCSKQQIEGFELCSYGWASDWAGAWVSEPVPGCPWTGFGDLVAGWAAGAYCCVERPVL